MAVTKKGSTYQAAQQAVQKTESHLSVKIFSPDQIYFDGQAVSVSARNATGPFDVLVGHINFLCLLEPDVIRINTGFQNLEFPIAHGILRVAADVVTVFVGV